MLIHEPTTSRVAGNIQTGERSNRQLLGLTLFLIAGTCLFHLLSAAAGHSIYRDQHLGTAIEYSKSGINLLKPVIIGFNATGTPTPQELPLWQAMTALAFKAFGPWYGCGNVVSLISFFTCLFPLFELARTFFGSRRAWWTLIFFLAQPLVFDYAGEGSPDGFSIASTIWFLYFAVRLLQTGKIIWWLPACLSGAIAATSKLPFFMAAGLTCFFLAILYHRNSIRPWLLLGSVGLVVIVLFFAWTSYTNRCIAEAEFPFVDLRISNPDTFFWYFGDWHYRLQYKNWFKGGWRIFNACFGSFALVGLMIYSLLLLRDSVFAILSLLAACLTTGVFVHLVLHHGHYYLMFCPGIAILCAQAAVDLEKKLVIPSGWKSICALLAVALVLSLSIVQGMIGMKTVFSFDTYPQDIAKIIRQYCHQSDKLLIEGGGWGGHLLMLTNLRGMSIWNTKLLEDKKNYDRLKSLGYNKLVMISESPLLTALQKINPGESRRQRETYQPFLTPVAKDWPTLYQDENILIKEIP